MAIASIHATRESADGMNDRYRSHTGRVRNSLAKPHIARDQKLQVGIVTRSYAMHLLHHIACEELIMGMWSVDLLIQMDLDDRCRIATDEEFLRAVEGEMDTTAREEFRERVIKEFLANKKAGAGESDPLDSLNASITRFLSEITESAA